MKLMTRTQKVHNQIMCDYQGMEIYGGATCPYCHRRVRLISVAKRLMIESWTESKCQHADMPVDAGGGQVAIHFKDLIVTKVER